MKLNSQRRIAADLLKCSVKRVVFDKTKLAEIKEAITKTDLRGLINSGVISKKQIKGVSRARARKTSVQKKKGKRKGVGSRKGKKTARTPRKREWINKIRLQRGVLADLKSRGKLALGVYRDLYRKAKGGFFRSKRHLQLYISEHGLIKKK